jgi:hypothetical protein
MRYPSERPAERYVGWRLSENLLECILTRGGPKQLCAEFRYVVLHDGVEVPQREKVHLPESIVLPKDELLSQSPRARAGIMGIRGELVHAALEKFRRYEEAQSTPNAEIIQMRQPAAAVPLKYAMKG